MLFFQQRQLFSLLNIFCALHLISLSSGWLSGVRKTLDNIRDVVEDARDAAKNLANGQLCFDMCGWADWGAWSECSVSCGGGNKHRQRGLCAWAWLSPEEKLDHCNKNAADQRDSQSCGQICIQGQWSYFRDSCQCPQFYRGSCCEQMIAHWLSWQSWTSCSTTCGSGTRSRSRICSTTNRRDHCHGNRRQSELCGGLPSCPVTQWAEWGVWTSCSTTCNTQGLTATRTRTRACIAVAANERCSGSSTDMGQCSALPQCRVATTQSSTSVPTTSEQLSTTESTSTSTTQLIDESTPSVNIQFTVIPKNFTSNLGDTVIFECITQPETDVSWYHNDHVISDAEQNVPYTILPGGILIISSVQTENIGRYTCEAVIHEGRIQASGWLTIPGTPHSCSPEIKTSPQNITVPVGAFAIMECLANHGSVTSWFKENTQQNDEVNIYYDYEYERSNIYYDLEDERSRVGKGENFTFKQDTRIYIGSTLKYHSHHSHHQPSSRHNRGRVASSNRTQMTGLSVLRNGYLLINSVEMTHAGTYICEVEENNCTATRRATITVFHNISEVCGTQVHNVSTWHIPRQQGHIAGGKRVKVGSAPWQVMLAETRAGFFCGGVIINRYWMLTAAHCFTAFRQVFHRPLTPRNLIIKVGKHVRSAYREPYEQVKHMSRKIIHPLYNASTFHYDIALIRFTSPVDLNDYVRPVCLPYDQGQNLGQSFLEDGTVGIVTGWGRVSDNGPLSREMSEVQVPVQHELVCRNSTTYQVTSSMFCAGYGDSNIAKDACKGDSGGPFVIPVQQSQQNTDQTKWVLGGIVSWGIGCGEDGNYGFYTNVSTAVNWIQREMSLL